MDTLFLNPPPDFKFQIRAAGCYCEYEDKILLLKRHPSKVHGNTWGVPGGKLDTDETAAMAVVREVFEETGITLILKNLENMGSIYVRRATADIDFCRFAYRLSTLPVINLALEEHTEARWVTPQEVLELSLMDCAKECFLLYRNYRAGKAKA
jgi:8-oxo-dGTP diphosphatase